MIHFLNYSLRIDIPFYVMIGLLFLSACNQADREVSSQETETVNTTHTEANSSLVNYKKASNIEDYYLLLPEELREPVKGPVAFPQSINKNINASLKAEIKKINLKNGYLENEFNAYAIFNGVEQKYLLITGLKQGWNHMRAISLGNDEYWKDESDIFSNGINYQTTNCYILPEFGTKIKVVSCEEPSKEIFTLNWNKRKFSIPVERKSEMSSFNIEEHFDHLITSGLIPSGLTNKSSKSKWLIEAQSKEELPNYYRIAKFKDNRNLILVVNYNECETENCKHQFSAYDYSTGKYIKSNAFDNEKIIAQLKKNGIEIKETHNNYNGLECGQINPAQNTFVLFYSEWKNEGGKKTWKGICSLSNGTFNLK